MEKLPSFQDVLDAVKRIESFIHRTPVLTCESLNRIVGTQLFFKCENFQKVGAFKFRGACNTVFSLTPTEIGRGVATHSSGNHAAALALAAQKRQAKAFIVMPKNSPAVKKDAVSEYGGEIVYCESTLTAREQALNQVIKKTGAIFVHPYNDARVIAGQGTAALELLEEVPQLDIILVPVGGGGLLSGTAISAAHLSPTTRVIAVEPAGAADAFRSFQTGKIIPSIQPETIADGLRTSLGELTFAIIQKYVSDIVTVSEATIVKAMRLVWERMKIVVEPSAAVPLAGLLENKTNGPQSRVGIILSGGNVDLENLPWSN